MFLPALPFQRGLIFPAFFSMSLTFPQMESLVLRGGLIDSAVAGPLLMRMGK